MDRLTYRQENGKAAFRSGTPVENVQRYPAMLDRLAAYEDTGLEPEEITEYLNATDEYVEASEEGRLIVLPSDPYEMADVAQEILSRACRLQREAEAALGGVDG